MKRSLRKDLYFLVSRVMKLHSILTSLSRTTRQNKTALMLKEIYTKG